MKRLLKEQNRKKTKLKLSVAQMAIAMAILTLISKGLGFVREMVIAGCFGTSYVVDAYVMAQNIPNIMFAGIFSAVSTSFMPIFSEKMEKNGELAANSFVNDVLNLLLKTSLFVAIFGMLLAQQFVQIFATGFGGEQATLTVFFLRVAFLFLIFNSANLLIIAYLQYKGSFLQPIIVGYVQNFIIIIFVIIGAYLNKKIIIFGLLCSHIVIYFLLSREAKKMGLMRSYSFNNSGVAKQIMVLALPAFVGGYVAEINTYVDKLLASGLPEGSVAALNYALLIVGLVSGVTVSIISTITFPKLNQARAAGEQSRYNEMLSKSFNLIFVIAVPFSMGAMVFSKEVVSIIYERGAFDGAATAMTATALFWYGPHLAASTLNTLIVQAYQSNKDMKTPMYIGIFIVAINVSLNFLLVEKMGVGGLALATSIAGIVGVIVRVLVLKKKYPQIKLIESKLKLLKIVCSAIIAITGAHCVYGWWATGECFPRTIAMLVTMFVATGIYYIFLKLFGIEEIVVIKGILKHKKSKE